MRGSRGFRRVSLFLLVVSFRGFQGAVAADVLVLARCPLGGVCAREVKIVAVRRSLYPLGGDGLFGMRSGLVTLVVPLRGWWWWIRISYGVELKRGVSVTCGSWGVPTE